MEGQGVRERLCPRGGGYGTGHPGQWAQPQCCSAERYVLLIHVKYKINTLERIAKEIKYHGFILTLVT